MKRLKKRDRWYLALGEAASCLEARKADIAEGRNMANKKPGVVVPINTPVNAIRRNSS